MKKFVALSAVAAMAIMANAATEAEEIAKLKEELSTLKETVKEIKIHDAADNVKFSIDFRAGLDNINYETAEGKSFGNGNLMTNRLQLGMAAQPAENLTFNGLLSYNKAYGAAPSNNNTGMPQRGYGYDTFDWVINENLTDNTLKVKEASFFYYGDMGVPYTVSVGRRPSTDGMLANHREGASRGKSPLGHSINVEYDGASFLLKDLTDFGTSFKICAGRGLTNARSRFNMDGGLSSYGDYSEDASTIDSVDMYGIIFVPYDDGQYKVSFMGYQATNLPGFLMTDVDNFYGADNEANTGMVAIDWYGANGVADGSSTTAQMGYQFNSAGTLQMRSLGEFAGQVLSFEANGIGDGWSDFLDNTTFFASYARSTTTPNKDYSVVNMDQFMGFMGSTPFEAAVGMYMQGGMTQAAAATQVIADLDGVDGSTPDGAISVDEFEAGLGSSLQSSAQSSAVDSGMLGSSDNETGSSIWVGLTIPAMFTEDGRIGLEYNKGDKYWRSFTYGEDTMIGSKLAARGSAFEAYYNQPLVDQYLTMQLRYTAITYEYTGSQGFFGDEGTPMSMDDAKDMNMDPIEKATDIRFSITYNY